VAHTVDVDGMLAGMEPRQFDQWQAEHNLEPWGDDWRQTGTIAAAIDNGFAAVAAAFGGEPPEPRQPRDYYRKTKHRHHAPIQRYLTAEESLARDRLLWQG
jgi:hypothetical protein